ncbi:MAG: hypoxanthine phosphoribosyltransferase [Saprospiraceae bacterium]|jgi:hypoxanthine phosphoribosyltransferase|nr:hypoxanthine phosphoribosyltransferase [Saprospiraceae bacterium]
MSDSLIQVNGLRFKSYLTEEKVLERVTELGKEISEKYKGQKPLFLGVLNGAFIFAADLVRACNIECEISFIKLSSYEGLESSGSLQTHIGLTENVEDRVVILVEDIVDTGRTMHQFLPDLQKLNPAKIVLVTLFLKRDALQHEVPMDYIGFSIPSDFIIGYGLDYDGCGRNLKGIYQLAK